MADDDDWDSVPITLNVKKPVSNVPVDEDEERVEIEEVKTKETSKPKNAVDEKTALAKANMQSKAKQREREEELARQASNAKPMTAEEKAAEAVRLRKLVEDSDNELLKDMFGGGKVAAPVVSVSAMQAKARDGVQDIDSLTALFGEVQLDTPRQMVDMSVALAKRLELLGRKSSLNFLKELTKVASGPLSDEEVNDLIGSLTIIKNEKVKAKLAKNKKTAAAPKPKLNTSGLDKVGGDRYDMDGVDERGARGGVKNPYDDDDFM